MSGHFSSLAHAYGQPTVSGQLKQSPSDFIVREQLSFEPSGEGEHLFVLVKKIGLNTLEVAERLAQHFHVHPRYVSYAGLKDKNAIVTQWFCLPFPIKSIPNFKELESDAITVIDFTRNSKKLKRGAIKINKFDISLHHLDGDLGSIDERIKLVKENGVPNYFGAQRFGRNENNLDNAMKLFSGKIKCSRNKKSIYLSAARSFLFNEILSQRVKDKTWNRLLEGDVASLNASRSFFILDKVDSDLQSRLKQGDIHPSAALWGKGPLMTQLEVKKLEEDIINSHTEIAAGLIKQGLQQERRATRLRVNDFDYHLNADTLKLTFSLISGAYATCVIREILNIKE